LARSRIARIVAISGCSPGTGGRRPAAWRPAQRCERLLRRQSAEDDRIHAPGDRLGPDVIEEVISALAWVSLDLAPTTIVPDEDGTRLAASAAADEYLFGFVHYSN
jgi:hypothetical protein